MSLLKKLKKDAAQSKSLTFQWNEVEGGNGTFVAVGKSEKQVGGTFSVSDGEIQLKLTSNDYSKSYIKRLMARELRTVGSINVQFNEPQSGSELATKHGIDSLQPGAKVTLGQGTYYYSVDSDLVDCNGWPLRESFQAIFQRQIKERCSSDSPTALNYTVFKLL